MSPNTSFDTKAGRLVLNFTNTVYERPGYTTPTPSEPVELLNSPDDLLDWCGLFDFIAKAEIGAVYREWKRDPDLASRTLRKVISIREDLFRAIYSFISTSALPKASIDTLNNLIEKLPHRRLRWNGKQLALDWVDDLSFLELITAPIIQDAVELFTTEDLDRLRVCSAPDCGWLFIDRSKNGRKRWCNMADCGNREKQRKYYRSH